MISGNASGWGSLSFAFGANLLIPCSPIRSGQQTPRSEEHTSELQSRGHLVCRLLLESPPTLYIHSFPTRRSSDLYSTASKQDASKDLSNLEAFLRGRPIESYDFGKCIRLGFTVIRVWRESVNPMLSNTIRATNSEIGRAHV